MAKSVISTQNPHIGTDTENGYQYPWDRGKVVPLPIKVVWVPIHSEGLVPVPIKVVPVSMLLATLFLHALHY